MVGVQWCQSASKQVEGFFHKNNSCLTMTLALQTPPDQQAAVQKARDIASSGLKALEDGDFIQAKDDFIKAEAAFKDVGDTVGLCVVDRAVRSSELWALCARAIESDVLGITLQEQKKHAVTLEEWRNRKSSRSARK